MGKVRTEQVKRLARELVERFPDKFTLNFAENKESVNVFTDISSKKLRNRLAGYITRLVTLTSRAETPESEEAT